MAVTKPIMLDETGKSIVEALTQKEITQQRIAEINAAKDEAIDEIDAKLPGIESKVNEINETLLHKANQTEVYDLEFLGWSVPSECPIQNYIDSNGDFHQRVGRVAMGTLNWLPAISNVFYCDFSGYKHINGKNCYASVYATVDNIDGASTMVNRGNKTIALFYPTNYNRIYINDNSYNDNLALKNALNGKYFYYELATEVIIKNGNEKVTEINNSLLHKHITVQNQNDGSAKTLATLICESIKNSENGTYICNGSWVNHSRGYVAQVSMTTYYDNTRKCINGLITAYDGNSYIFIADVINGTVSNVKVSNSIAMS